MIPFLTIIPSCDPVGVVALQSTSPFPFIVFIMNASSMSSSMRDAPREGPMGRRRLDRNAVTRSVPEGCALALYELSRAENRPGKKRRNSGQRAGIEAATMARLLSMGETAQPRE